MAMEKDNNDHASNVAVTATAEQATKVNDADARLSPENRQTGVVVVSESVSGSEKGEEGAETAVAAVAVEEDDDESGGSSLVPPRSSSARVPFTNLSQIDSDLALARTLQEQVLGSFLRYSDDVVRASLHIRLLNCCCCCFRSGRI